MTPTRHVRSKLTFHGNIAYLLPFRKMIQKASFVILISVLGLAIQPQLNVHAANVQNDLNNFESCADAFETLKKFYQTDMGLDQNKCDLFDKIQSKILRNRIFSFIDFPDQRYKEHIGVKHIMSTIFLDRKSRNHEINVSQLTFLLIQFNLIEYYAKTEDLIRNFIYKLYIIRQINLHLNSRKSIFFDDWNETTNFILKDKGINIPFGMELTTYIECFVYFDIPNKSVKLTTSAIASGKCQFE